MPVFIKLHTVSLAVYLYFSPCIKAMHRYIYTTVV